jgi:hypothetical protein
MSRGHSRILFVEKQSRQNPFILQWIPCPAFCHVILLGPHSVAKICRLSLSAGPRFFSCLDDVPGKHLTISMTTEGYTRLLGAATFTNSMMGDNVTIGKSVALTQRLAMLKFDLFKISSPTPL